MVGSFSGIIFDFNGTLLWDSSLHEKAWNQMARKYIGRELTNLEMEGKVHGRNNTHILSFLFDKSLSQFEILQFANEKEDIYRRLCLDSGNKFSLAPGAIELLDYLVSYNIPRAIATSSDNVNVQFYREHLNLDRWFEPELFIYDDGSFNGKPAPDIYLKAFHALNLPARDCLIVEDAISGIQSALASKVGQLFVINEAGNFNYIEGLEGITKIIYHFSELELYLKQNK